MEIAAFPSRAPLDTGAPDVRDSPGLLLRRTMPHHRHFFGTSVLSMCATGLCINDGVVGTAPGVVFPQLVDLWCLCHCVRKRGGGGMT